MGERPAQRNEAFCPDRVKSYVNATRMKVLMNQMLNAMYAWCCREDSPEILLSPLAVGNIFLRRRQAWWPEQVLLEPDWMATCAFLAIKVGNMHNSAQYMPRDHSAGTKNRTNEN